MLIWILQTSKTRASGTVCERGRIFAINFRAYQNRSKTYLRTTESSLSQAQRGHLYFMICW